MIRTAILSVTLVTAVVAADFKPYERVNPTPNLKKAMASKLEVKRPLKFGMIKLTDCAAIVVAKELGYFADEGIAADIIVQPNWQAVRDNLVNGDLDGSHML